MTDTPLAESFRRLIAATGPISLAQFMGESNARYYASRDPLGAAGDFTTAPEISQMFGELVGLWLTDIWIRAGHPQPVHYVEPGPGRGTLARDALRVMRKQGLHPQVHLVEASAALKPLQLAAVPDAQFHDDLSTVPMQGAILLVANEFLDALPVRQLVRMADGWRERMVGVVDDKFAFVAGRQPMDAAVPESLRTAEEGTILETCPAASATMFELCGRLGKQGGAALFIDYGHDTPRTGSTLQAISRQSKVDPFFAPGEADLTAHVDFAMMAQIALSREVQWLGTAEQGKWLKALGIDARAASLAQASPEQSDAVEAARHRLTDAEEMGRLFKVMGLAAPDWPPGAGFV